MGRSDYISDSLVNIRDRLKNYSTGASALPNADSAANGVSARQALQGRAADAIQTRRDLATRFTAERHELEAQMAELAARADALNARLDELGQLPENPASDDHSAVGEYFRQIENIRLDYLREQTLRDRHADCGAAAATGAPLVEVLSISRRQWHKIGFSLALPLIIAIEVAAVLIALAILIGMGVL